MKSKTVLITGSSKGLGKSLAIAFAEEKYNIIIHGRDKIALEQVKKEILYRKVNCDIVIGDITSTKTIEKLYRIAVKRNFDILVNNAGMYLNESFESTDINIFKKVIETNLLSPILLIHKVYPSFRQKKSGIIININSIAGKYGSYGETAYCASKHGLRGFSQAFQFEVTKDNVRLLDIYLGSMNTQMTSERKDSEKRIQTDEVSNILITLCKDYPSLRINEINITRRNY